MLGFFSRLVKSLISLPLDSFSIIIAVCTKPALLIRVAIPYLIGILVSVVLITLVLSNRESLASILVASSSSEWIHSIATFGVVIIGTILAALMSFVATLIIAAISIEFFIEALLIHYGVQVKASSIGVASVLRGVRDGIVFGVISLLIGVMLFVGGFLPFLAIPVAIISILVLGRTLIDTTLSIAGLEYRERGQILSTNYPHSFTIGALGVVTSMIPFGNILFLPIIYGVVVRRFADPLMNGDWKQL